MDVPIWMASNSAWSSYKCQRLESALLDLSNTPQLAEVGTQAVDLTCYEQLIERSVAQ